jgi:hypothetical protein
VTTLRHRNAYFTGTITKLPATNAGVWEVTFSDGNKLDYDTEPEIRQVLDVTKMEQWQPLVTKLKGGFTYLENRLTNNCDSPYHLKVQHEATKLLRAFDPSLASGLVDTNYVDVIRYMQCTACAWEASGAVSGKFREISAPAAPLANFSLNFAKLLQTPSADGLGLPHNLRQCDAALGGGALPCALPCERGSDLRRY